MVLSFTLTRRIGGLILLLFALTHASSASLNDGNGNQKMEDIKLTEDNGGNGNPSIDFNEGLAMLVHDFLKIRSQELLDGNEFEVETLISFDASEFKRREKEIKDRYDVVYSIRAKQVGKPNPNPFAAPPEEETGLIVNPELLAQLEPIYKNTYIGTRSNWKDFLDLESRTPEVKEFVTLNSKLKQQHQEILKIYSDVEEESAVIPFEIKKQIGIESLPIRDPSNEKNFLLFNISHLPTHQELIEIFSWLDPSHFEEEKDTKLNFPEVFQEDVSKAGPVHFTTPLDWIYFYSNKMNKICEVFNYEYLWGLAAYLKRRIGELQGAVKKKKAENDKELPSVTILEVGAGNGRLSHFLNEFLKQEEDLQGKYSLIATDLEGNVGDFSNQFPVVKLDSPQSIKTYRPTIILCSWMSMQLDLTSDFRKSKHVKEYILIGEVDYGVSGTYKETWGLPSKEKAPYEKDGFKRIVLEKLSMFQIGRSDHPFVRFHSQTTVFRRV